MIDRLVNAWLGLPEGLREVLVQTILIVIVVVTIVLCVAFLTYVERKVIGHMQARIGPNRVGPFGLLQPFADVIKLILKEIIIPANAARFLFLTAPLISMAAAFATWAVVPFSPEFVFADIDAGLLYILALTSMSVYGIIIAGWATNSKYAFLGAMRPSHAELCVTNLEYISCGAHTATWFRSEIRIPRASVRWVWASSSEPNWAKASRSRYWASSSFRRPATFRIARIWAEPPTRDTEMPTFRAGRTPEKNSFDSRKICPSVIEITFVGM